MSVKDVRAYRGVSWNTDHFLLIAPLRERTSNVQKLKSYTLK